MEGEEAAAEQRALLASFETKRRDKTARKFIHTERREATVRVAATTQEGARHEVHRQNMAVARAAVEQRQLEEDRREAEAARQCH
jgi:hypothetical protein